MKICIIFVILLSLIQPCRGVEFRNLDFQSPNVRKITERFGLVRDIIPGWQLQIGDQDQDWIYYNNVCFTCPSALLQGPEIPRIGDTFEFGMKSGFLPGVGTWAGVSIYQVGEVPASAKSINFQVSLGFRTSIEDLHVSINNTRLPLFESDPMSHGVDYQADVSAWAGGTVELRFTIEPGDIQDVFDSSVGLGAIEFSPTPIPAIPEPTTWALLATGLAALGWATRNSKQRPAN